MRTALCLTGLALLIACDRGSDPAIAASAAAPNSEAVAAAVEPPAQPEAGKPKPAEPESAKPETQPLGLAELTDAQRTAMYVGHGDAIEPTRIHHVKSNESRHDLFFPYIRDRGGAYLGVAADTNYTLIAIAKPEYAFLLDIDQAVVNTHRLYSVFIPMAKTPDELMEYFADANADAGLEIIDEGLADHSTRDRIRAKTTFKVVRRVLLENLQEIRRREHDGTPTTWMSDPESYAYVRRMFQTDRIRIMSGDLRGENAMTAVADAVTKLETTINVMYESNAAEWFVWHKPYRRNMRALPVSDDAVLCRTIDTKPARTHHGRSFVAADGRWNYNVHALADYHQGLLDAYFNRNQMLKLVERKGLLQRETGTAGLSLIALNPA